MFYCPFKKKCIKELEEVKLKLILERGLVRSRENLVESFSKENNALLVENKQLKEASAVKTIRVILVEERK